MGYEVLNGQPNENILDVFYLKESVNHFGDETVPNSKLNNGNASGISIEVLETGDVVKITILLKNDIDFQLSLHYDEDNKTPYREGSKEVNMKFIVSDNAKTELKNVLDTKKDPSRHFRIYIRGYS